MRFLIITLHAPIGSFGAVAVGEMRSSWPRPARSAMLGMTAAALGVDRGDEDAHQSLENGLGYAVRTDAPGELFTDYHTVTAAQPLRRQHFTTRRKALLKGKHNTLVSQREWFSDSFFTVCFWSRPEVGMDLDALAAALDAPVFTLFCGRKAGSLGLPLRPEVLQAEGLLEGLKRRRFNEPESAVLKRLIPTQNGEPWIACDADAPGLPTELLPEVRTDALVSRSQWSFAAREEAVLLRGEPLPQ